jgi:hypothetical protein
MADRQILFDNDSNLLRFKLRRSDTGQGLTGLTTSTTNLTISTICDVEAAATSYGAATSTIELVTTLGTFLAPSATKCRIKEVDSANHPGVYEFHFADARFSVTSSRIMRVSVIGAANLLEREFEIELVQYNPYDSVRMGMTSLPAAGQSINADVKKINGVTLKGAGTVGDKWGPA